MNEKRRVRTERKVITAVHQINNLGLNMIFIVSEFVMQIKTKNQMQSPTFVFGISKIRFMSSVQEEKIITVGCFIKDLDFFLLSRRQISYVSVSGVCCSWQVANVGNQKEETQNAPRALAFGGKRKGE